MISELYIIASHFPLNDYIALQCAFKSTLPVIQLATLAAYKQSVMDFGIDVSKTVKLNNEIDIGILIYLIEHKQIEYLRRIPKLKNIFTTKELVQYKEVWANNSLLPQCIVLHLFKKSRFLVNDSFKFYNRQGLL